MCPLGSLLRPEKHSMQFGSPDISVVHIGGLTHHVWTIAELLSAA
jgi:hypothetical protein